ncbi:MAG: peptidase M4 [Halieaceae bacterium]|nr:peptidase M4 [Halieaceae bacterium]
MTSNSIVQADDQDDLSASIPLWVKQGKVIPLESLMQMHGDRLQGRLIDLEVEQDEGRIIYELEIMRENSVVYEIKIDAENGEWLEEEVEH